ncbi:MAG: SWIB/MDM2 domain-containing protein [Chlamydiales bacterium]
MAQKKKNTAFMQPVQISDELKAVVGPGPLPRTEIIKKLWAYIKKNNCQDTKNKRNIIPDEKLAKVFGSKSPIDMFQMTKKVSNHIRS